jgi:hypothetical protein
MKNGLEIDQYGHKRYYLNGQLHRADGPAIEFTDGSKVWYIHGHLHRLDGPAVDYSYGNKYWHLHGKYLPIKTQQEFEQYLRLVAFI